MRWLFLLLLLVNIVYVGWELNRERPQRTVAELPGGVEPIVLLSELGTETAVRQQAVAADAADTPVKSKARPPVKQVPPVQSEPELKPEPAPKTPARVAAVAETVVETKAAETQPAVVVPEPPAADMCYTLGPFRKMKTLRLVTREIKDYVVEASFRSKEEQEQTMFRVFVRPVGSHQEAKAMTRELLSKNIKDYFIITEGENKNGISLGYFSTKSRAYRHADHVRRLGFDATAEPVFSSYTIYWLDYRIKSGRNIPQRIFDDHLEDSKQKLNRTCS